MRSRRGLIVGFCLGIAVSTFFGHVFWVGAQQTFRPGCSVDHPIDVPKDLSGLSIKNPRIRIVHTTDPELDGGSMYLQTVDPWLGYAWGRSLFQFNFRERDGVFGEAGKLDHSKPTVGLLSIGEEDAKGNEQVKAARPLLVAQAATANANYQFFGNVEGRDIAKGTVDVVVCDGFVGNVVLKMAEGFANFFLTSLKESLTSTPQSKLAAFILTPALRRMRNRLDYVEYGGAALVGVNGNCIICHGSANARAITAAIRVAKLVVEADVPGKIKTAIAARAPIVEAASAE